MFNIGILASSMSAPNLVKLTPRRLTQGLGGGFYYSGIELSRQGVAHDRYNASPDIMGEWWIPGPTTGIGSSYEARATHLSGSLPTNGLSVGEWFSLSTERSWGWKVPTLNGGGRILLEIRNASSFSVVASAQFWTPGHAP